MECIVVFTLLLLCYKSRWSTKTNAKGRAGRGQTFSVIEIRRIDTLILHSPPQPYINYSQYIS
jgi:hypothetical protein